MSAKYSQVREGISAATAVRVVASRMELKTVACQIRSKHPSGNRSLEASWHSRLTAGGQSSQSKGDPVLEKVDTGQIRRSCAPLNELAQPVTGSVTNLESCFEPQVLMSMACDRFQEFAFELMHSEQVR
jgi:hypothetical protein